MKRFKGKIIIGIDHGYGNVKTANCCFPTAVMSYDSEPPFTRDMLVYDGRYYLIGEGHKESSADKSADNEYYVLTLAAIAKDLHLTGLTEGNIHVAAGLPLTWTAGQKEPFMEYLLQKKEVSFFYNKVPYNIHVTGAGIYPQGYAAVAPMASILKGINLIADVGSGTMNVLYLIDGVPQTLKMYIEKFGTYKCTLTAREAFIFDTQREVNDYTIEKVLRTGSVDIPEGDLAVICTAASEYVNGIFRRLRGMGTMRTL